MKISLIGMGPGAWRHITTPAAERLRTADAIIGAPRLLTGLPEQLCSVRVAETKAPAIAALLAAHSQWQQPCVLFGGDVGFYSGAKRLLPLLAAHEVELLPGLSSLSYLAARLHTSWQDMHVMSLHASEGDVLAAVLNHPRVFFLMGSERTPDEMARRLCAAGLPEAQMTVGEQLGYADERLVRGTAQELAGQRFAPLSVLLVENANRFTRDFVTQGIPDASFIRANVPMTKQEVRAVALAKLGIAPTDLLYDIGAGTGSVAVEMALLARRGKVFAIEKNVEACALIARNRLAFGVYQLEVRQGTAPAALAALPAPDAVFIGGSGGQVEGILQAVQQKNPAARVALTAITIETLHRALACLQALGYADIEVTQVAVSRSVPVGGAHMLRALNPIFILSTAGVANNV